MSADSYRIAVGADHGGVELKNAIVEALKKAGRDFVDYGTHGADSVDYADFANEVGRFLRTTLACVCRHRMTGSNMR